MGRGRLVGPSAERVTFVDLKQLVEWDYKASEKTSLDRAERAFKNLEGFFGLCRAVDVTAPKLMEYVTTRQEQSIRPATIKYELSMLRRAFNLAIAADKLQTKPHFPNIEVHNTRSGSLPSRSTNRFSLICPPKSDR
jgi:hypothetical protein